MKKKQYETWGVVCLGWTYSIRQQLKKNKTRKASDSQAAAEEEKRKRRELVSTKSGREQGRKTKNIWEGVVAATWATVKKL